ncbi:MAG: tandem-95 repeat protein [Pirellulales bacterium]|nr:tandem-95 repeat protein [Pirellulales bacterium]
MKTRRARRRDRMPTAPGPARPPHPSAGLRLRKLAVEPLEQRMLLDALGLIAGTVFNDLDRDGIGDPSEPGLPGLGMELRPVGHAAEVLRTFNNPAPGQSDQFGRSLAAVGDNVLIGAYLDDTLGEDTGAAYLLDGTTGQVLQTFLDPTPADDDRFGRSVAALGGNVLIGAYGGSGAVYLFDGSTGALLQTFLNPTPAYNDQFGRSVAAVGENVLVGARFDDTGEVDAGAAYLFDTSTGQLLQTFFHPSPEENDQFGYCVAALGNDVLVGARYDDTGADDAGVVYHFDASTGELLQTFCNPMPAAGDAFGRSVAAVEGNVLVGARFDDARAEDAGAAYLFDGATGELLQTFFSPAPTVAGEFGYCVAAAGRHVLVGARADVLGAPGAGAAYLFDAATGNVLETFRKPLAAVNDHFGVAVAAVGEHVLVAADDDDSGAENAGSAYLFRSVAEPDIATTNDHGDYLFDGIEPGRYQVRLAGLPGCVRTLPGDGLPYLVDVAAGQAVFGLDFGVADNEPPAAIDDGYSAGEDSMLFLAAADGVLANDSDADGDVLTASLLSGPLHGSLTLQPDGALIYRPLPDFSGVDRFRYRAVDFNRQAVGIGDDAGATTDTATVTITVVAANDPPTAADDAYRVDEDATLTVPAAEGVLANDRDVDGDSLTASLIVAPSHGVLTLRPDGSLVYEPDDDFFGTDSFTYLAADASSGSNVARVVIGVAAVCDGGLGGVVFEDLDRNGVHDQGEPGLEGLAVRLQGFGCDPVQTFANPRGRANQYFGSSLAALGDDVLIGAFADDTAAPAAGAVYRFDAATGSLLQTFVSPAPSTGDYFGLCLAAVGGNVLVGAPYADTAAEDAGAAFLFDGNDGRLLQTFLDPSPTVGDGFGVCVAAWGDYVLVGAEKDDDAGTDTGTVYLFDAATGELLRTFLNPTPAQGDAFGCALAAVGDKILVGAYRDDTRGIDAGAAYLFDGTTGALLYTLLPPAPAAYDRFGSAVAAVGGNLLVGAYGDDTGASSAGAAYLFDGATGNLLHTLSNPTPTDYDCFGYAVAAVGDYLLVGAYGDDTAGDNAGAAYLFDPTTGHLLQTVTKPQAAADDRFGVALAAVGERVLVGAYGDDAGGRDAGAAHLVATLDAPACATSGPDGAYAFSGFHPGTYVVRQTPAEGFDLTYPPPQSHTVTVANDSGVWELDFGNAANQAPLAADDAYSVAEDGVLSPAAATGVLGNDDDSDHDALTAELLSEPLHGSLALQPDGSFVYTPEMNFHGTDRFVYRASDGLTDSSAAMVTITVTPVNDAPTAAGDDYQIRQNGTLWVPASGVLANDTDIDFDALTAVLGVGPAHGTIELRSNGSFGYTPQPGFFGSDRFTYRADDGAGVSSEAVVEITVVAVFDAVLSGTVFADLDRNGARHAGEPGLADWEIELQRVDAFEEPLRTRTDATGTYGFSGLCFGAYRIGVLVPPGYGQTFPADLDGYAITVVGSQPIHAGDFGIVENEPPTAADDTFSLLEDTTLAVQPPLGLLANDSDSHTDLLTALLISSPAHGALELQHDGSFAYTPDADFHGTDRFAYCAGDAWDVSGEAWVTLVVDPVNDVPTAADDHYLGNEDAMLVVPAPGVMANDADVDHDALTASLIAAPSHGRLTLRADGSFEYTPDGDFFGTDLFTYKSNDQVAGSSVAVVAIDVRPVSDGGLGGTLFEDLDRDGVHDSGESPIEGQTVELESVGGEWLQTFLDPTYDSGQFGRAVAALGRDVLVGDYDADTGAEDTGAAYLFDGTTGQLMRTFANPTPNRGDHFGRSVAAVGDNVLVGAYRDDAAGEDAGVAYLFDAATGKALLTFFSPAPRENDQFGRAVAAVGNNVLIGARFDDTGAEDAGAAYLFDGATGELLLQFRNPTPSEDDQFGYCVAALGRDILIGARLDDTGESDSGVVYRFDGVTGELLQTFVNPAPGESDAFGRSVAAVGGNVLVGARGDDTAAEDAGAAYLFDGETGLLRHTFFGPSPAPGDEFGFSVAGVGDDVLIGARFNGSGDRNGAAYLFDGESGELIQTFLAPGPDRDARFGVSVAAVGDNVLVGTQYGRAAYLFAAGPGTAATTTGADGSYHFTGFKPGTYRIRVPLPEGQVHTAPGGTGVHTITTAGDEQIGDLDFGQAENSPPTAGDDAYGGFEDTPLAVPASLGVLVNDGDGNGDPLLAMVVESPRHGMLALQPDGSFLYVPHAHFNGTDQFAYRASDGWSDSDVATVTLAVASANDPPSAADDDYAAHDDAPLQVAAPGVLANDTDLDGDGLTARLIAGPSHGALGLHGDGSFSYLPEPGFFGTDTFAYRAGDGIVESEPATVAIRVTPIYHGLLGGTAFEDLDRDGTRDAGEPGLRGWTVQLLYLDGTGKAVDTAYGDLPAAGGRSGKALTATTDADGSYWLSGFEFGTYLVRGEVPPGFVRTLPGGDGAYTITIDNQEDMLGLDFGSVENGLPQAGDDQYETDEDTQLSVAAPGVLANDGDLDGDALEALLADGPSHGHLVLRPDGSLAYTPDADFFGTDHFSYRATDGWAESEPAVVHVTVNPLNDAPTAADDHYTAMEDEVLVVAAPGVLANDADREGDRLSVTVVETPLSGILELSDDGSFRYTPRPDFFGLDGFTYRTTDGTDESQEVTVWIEVAGSFDGTFGGVVFEDLDRDELYDPGEPLLEGWTVELQSAGGATLASVPSDAQGNYRFHGFRLGAYRVRLAVADGFAQTAPGGSGTYLISILSDGTVLGLDFGNVRDQRPVAEDDRYDASEDGVLSVAAPGVLANDHDADGDPLTVRLLSGPRHGTLTLQPDGAFLYTPLTDYYGADQFTYRADDGLLEGNVATVRIAVAGVNDGPASLDDDYGTSQGGSLSVAAPGVLANDGDPEGDPLAAVLGRAPAHGVLELTPDGAFCYTPDADFLGNDSFTYKAFDGAAGSSEVVVSMVVNPVHHASLRGSVFEDLDVDGSHGANEPAVEGWTVQLQSLDDTGLLLRTFLEPAPDPGGLFGIAAAAVGDCVLVGAGNAGVAYLFDGNTRDLLQTFRNPAAASAGRFGYTVAAIGDDVLVGAPAEPPYAAADEGVYRFDGTTGELRLVLHNPTPDAADLFGCSVLAVGGNVLVGAAGDDTGAENAGAVYLFDGATGRQLATFRAPVPSADAAFGVCLAVMGQNVLIGAPGADVGGSRAGAAYLFDLTTGRLLQTFFNPMPAETDEFGRVIAVSGSRVVVGAPNDDTAAPDAGAVYLFDAVTGELLRTLQKPTPAACDHFGRRVAVLGGNVLVAAPDDDTGTRDAGAVYLFDASDGGLLRTFRKSEPSAYDAFGDCLAVLGNKVLVGAALDDRAGPGAGAVYLFDTGTTLASSDAQGVFSFAGLKPGSYRLCQLPPSGYVSTLPEGAGAYTIDLAANANLSGLDFGTHRTGVVGRYIFYNNSIFDGGDAAANSQDDVAVAPDKAALLPGQTATFANYTSYGRGINGVMIDVYGLAGVPETADFVFQVGNSADPGVWQPAADPVAVAVRPGAGVGGSDRITLVWADGAVRNRWLQVTISATATTGLPEADVFYFGNAVGDTGNATADARVNVIDMLRVRNNLRTFLDPAPIDFRYDHNRDGRVDATDLLIARNNQTHFLNALKLITAPAVDAGLGPSAAEPPQVFADAPGASDTGCPAPLPDGNPSESAVLKAPAGPELPERFWWSGWNGETSFAHTAAMGPAEADKGMASMSGGTATEPRVGSSDGWTTTLHYRFAGSPELLPATIGSWVSLEGETPWLIPGDPIVPSRTSHILLPPGTRIASVAVRPATPEVIATGADLAAAPPDTPTGVEPDFTDQTATKSFSSGVTFETQFLRGYSIGVLQVFPVAFEAGSGTVSFCDEIEVTVTTTVVDPPAILPVRRCDDDWRQTLDLVDNDSAIGRYGALLAGSARFNGETFPAGKAAVAGGSASSGSLPPGGPYEYIVVAPEELAGAFQPLVEHKIARGLDATVVTTEYIQANFHSPYDAEDDLAGKVRAFLAEAYLVWNTEWVLLGGDTDVAGSPYRYVRVEANGEDKTFLSDMYFACLDGPYNDMHDVDWAQDNDGIGGGDVDRMPDVYVGRAPASNVEEVATFVRKTILYETTPPPNATTGLWLGEKLYSEPITWGAASNDAICGGVVPEDYAAQVLYQRDGSYGRDQVMAALNAEPNFVHHLGHANAGSNAKLSPSDPSRLTNEHPYLFYSQGCLSGAFQYESMAEAHTVQADGAAVAAILNTHYGWYSPGGIPGGSHWWAWEFFDALFAEHRLHLGEAHFDAKIDRSSQSGTGRWVFYSSTLFGDPETRAYLPLAEPPAVVRAEPAGLQAVPVGSIRVEFSEPMAGTDFDLDDVVRFIGPGGVDLRDRLTGFQWRDFWTLEVFFERQTAAGAYELTLAPTMRDRQEMAVGTYTDDLIDVRFSIPVGFGDDRAILYRADMEADPGWTLQGQWAHGRPAGQQGDPSRGFSGVNVLGHSLGGDYPNNMARAEYAVSPPIDCTDHTDVTLCFWRWLGVENNRWDHATIDVSSDGGQTWATVWENGQENLSDASWTEQTVDLSAVADGQPDVQIRFGIGPTDASVVDHGWNIDDLTVTGTPDARIVLESPAASGDPPVVVAHEPTYSLAGPVRAVTLIFDQPMDFDSFNLADIDAFEGPSGDLTDRITGFHWLSEAVLAITFGAQSADGNYRMTIGPDVTDGATGYNAMAAAYTAVFAIGVARENDLLGAALDVTPGNLHDAAGTVEVCFSVFNAGANQAGPFGVRFYVSDDAEIDPTHDTLLSLADGGDSYRLAFGLDSGHSHSDTVTLLVPGSSPWDDHRGWLGMVVDADDEIAEDDEANNCHRGQGLDLDAVLHVAMRSPDNPADLTPGLVFGYYPETDGLDSVEQLGSLSPAARGVYDGFAIDPFPDEAEFGYIYSGYVYVDRDDLYTFYTYGGRSRLYLGSTLVVDNDIEGSGPTDEPSGQIALKAGYHELTLKYCGNMNNPAEGQLSVSFEGTESRKRPVPASALLHQVGSETRGPAVIRSTPAGEIIGDRRVVAFTFNEPMDTASFSTAEDVVGFQGPTAAEGDIAGFYWSADRRTLWVQTDGLTSLGEYTMTIGPGILDAAGNPMDQDGDGTAGEPIDDCRSATFTRVNAAPYVDYLFGNAPGEPGQWFNFSAHADDPDQGLSQGDVLRYAWDFGDGGPEDTGVGLRAVRHVFAEHGAYRVTLTVSDAQGATATAVLDVAVDEAGWLYQWSEADGHKRPTGNRAAAAETARELPANMFGR